MEVFRINISDQAIHYWKGIKLYYEKPKCINKEVLFSECILNAELHSASFTECRILIDKLYDILLESTNLRVDIKLLECLELNVLEYKNLDQVFTNQKGMFLLVRKLIPKFRVNGNLELLDFIFLDKLLSKIFIFTKGIPIVNYERHLPSEIKGKDPFVILKFNFIQLNWCKNFLEISYDKNLNKKGITWLKTVFLPKFVKLSNSVTNVMPHKKLNNLLIESKVDILQYYQLYEMMKLKYGKYFVEVKTRPGGRWTENTDPKKFVYEDIAIATYLMMLWNNGKIPGENVQKQRFFDLGCGNGLLVHILNSEGHLGIGLDVRKRKIWDIYPSSTILKEQTIIPTTESTYPDADWLIGNHSDELTAWIPILARLSNDCCQYFVLPCCPYQLNGMKFQRKNTSLSSYQDFLGYLQNVSEICGYKTYIDKLKIPSTKRICLIGLNNLEMSEHEYKLFVESAIKFVKEESQSLSFDKDKTFIQSVSENQLPPNVKVRQSVEAVRNCTKLPFECIQATLKIVMNELLKENVNCTVIKSGKYYNWNRGGKLAIQDLVSCLAEQLKKQLKNECKGLQTLLKNHHFIFEVNQGQVQLRKPESMLEISNKILEGENKEKWKMKKCWFFKNHPDRCPLADEVCSYSHED